MAGWLEDEIVAALIHAACRALEFGTEDSKHLEYVIFAKRAGQCAFPVCCEKQVGPADRYSLEFRQIQLLRAFIQMRKDGDADHSVKGVILEWQRRGRVCSDGHHVGKIAVDPVYKPAVNVASGDFPGMSLEYSSKPTT